MSKFVLTFPKRRTIIQPVADLVDLGILPKQVSEYTDADIGSIISIPYNDESGNIAGPIKFEVVGVNHHKDINDESKPTITLMSKNIIRYAAFDAKEPNNPDNNMATYGNSRWSVSNIRQWLNSNGIANKWFTPQHKYDVAPDTINVNSNNNGAYIDDSGFLAGFSNEVKQHFATVRNKTILCDYDKTLLSKDFEETEDKVFLPSYTEMGFGNIDSNNPEGVSLVQKVTNSSRKKTGANGWYWMRSPYSNVTCHVYLVYVDGRGQSYRCV